jgi:ankyrin repeat protein
MDMPPHARAGSFGRGHRFAAYPRCSTDRWEVQVTAEALVERIADGRTDLVWAYAGAGHSMVGGDGTRLLEWCTYYGDVSAVRFLVEHGLSLDSLGEDRGLNGAAFHGHWQLCEFLIEQGADVNHAAADTGETPLHSALCTPDRVRHDLVVRVLLAHGADVTRVTNRGVATGAFMRDCRTKGETCLHRAAAFGTEETVDLLLAAGAQKDARDANGDTPLSWASWYGRPDAVLRKLCYGEFRIRPDRKSMRASLLGWPRGGASGRTRG